MIPTTLGHHGITTDQRKRHQVPESCSVETCSKPVKIWKSSLSKGFKLRLLNPYSSICLRLGRLSHLLKTRRRFKWNVHTNFQEWKFSMCIYISMLPIKIYMANYQCLWPGYLTRSREEYSIRCHCSGGVDEPVFMVLQVVHWISVQGRKRPNKTTLTYIYIDELKQDTGLKATWFKGRYREHTTCEVHYN